MITAGPLCCGKEILKTIDDKIIIEKYNEISDEKEKKPAAVVKPTLKKGDKNEYVRSWRNYLITLGYQISAGDYFNTEMLEAVKDYQRKRKLTPDGMRGPLTWFTVGKA